MFFRTTVFTPAVLCDSYSCYTCCLPHACAGRSQNSRDSSIQRTGASCCRTALTSTRLPPRLWTTISTHSRTRAAFLPSTLLSLVWASAVQFLVSSEYPHPASASRGRVARRLAECVARRRGHCNGRRSGRRVSGVQGAFRTSATWIGDAVPADAAAARSSSSERGRACSWGPSRQTGKRS